MTSEILNFNWEAFHFLRPMFLWLLIPAVIALVLGLININRNAKWQKQIAPHLRKYVINQGSEKKISRLRVVTMLLVSLAILGLAGPTWKKNQVPGKILETPVIIILDMSQSMMAADIQPNRLERAKFKINDLLNTNPHARTALIGFAGTAHIIVPLTSDYKIILSHLDGLKPELIPVSGSNLEAALQLTDSISAVTDAPARLILFTDDFTDETFSLLQNLVTTSNKTIDIMPMNTIAGADIFKPGSKTPFKDKKGQVIHSSLNTEILNRLKSLKNINVNALTLDDSDVQLIARSVSDHLQFQEEDKEKEDEWEDRGLWFVIPLTLLALLWFRKGWVIFLFFFTLSITSCNNNTNFKDLWFTRDYQAQQHFDQGDFTKAAELFVDPMRKGIAFYKAGNYDSAIEAFAQDTMAEGAYNLGLAYYKNGDYTEAAIAFGKAVELNPDMGDAQKNQQLMQQYIPGMDEISTEDATEAEDETSAQNIQNKDMEDLGGGRQEATKEDMEKERKEETVETGKRKGKELEDVPDDFKSGESRSMENIVMQKVDDDPSLFLQRKFRYQLKKGKVSKPKNSDIEW